MDKDNISQKVLITFLGTGKYERVKYEFNPMQSGVGESCQEGAFAAICMARVWRPDRIVVFATSQAKQDNGPKLQEEAAKFVLEWADIPEGRNKEELLQIFQRLNEKVLPRSEVVIDVTHSFRSIPIIGLAAIHYLGFAKQVNIRHIWYGAYLPGQSGHFAVIDLRIFSELIDWLWAVRVFKETGETKPLAEVLEPYQKYLYDQGHRDPKVQSVAHSLERLSPLVVGVQVPALQRQAANAYEVLQEALQKGSLGEITLLLPEVVDSIKNRLNQLKVKYPENPSLKEKAFAQLEAQHSLLLAYLDWNRPAQAIILFREWLVSAALFVLGRYEGILLEKDKMKEALEQREAAENLLNSTRALGLRKEKAEKSLDDIVRIWDWVIQKRNAIAHAGMNTEGHGENILREDLLKEIQRKAEEVRCIIKFS